MDAANKAAVNGTTPVAPAPPQQQQSAVTPPQPATPKRLSQGDPQDDPRYFPLPKVRKSDNFDSDDDGFTSDEELFGKRADGGKDKSRRKGRPCKPGGPTERKRARQAQVKQPRALSDHARDGSYALVFY